MNMSCLRSLWWVLKGRAVAPPTSTYHGGLDLEEAALVEVAADVVDDLGAGGEDLAGLGVEHEVEVTLTETSLLVLEALELIGHHVEAGGEEDHLGGIDGELATLGTAGETLDTDDITTTDVAVEVPVVSAVALISEDLNGGAISLDLVED